MAWIFYLIVALLATLTVASSTVDVDSTVLESLFHAQLDAGADSSISTSLNGTNTLAESLGADIELKEWFAALNHATRLNETWSSEHDFHTAGADDSLSNITAADADIPTAAASAVQMRPKPNLDGYYRLDVRIGRGSTHVGTLRKGRMFKRMYAALKVCSFAPDNPNSPGDCNPSRPGCPEICRLPNIVYDRGNLNYAADSFLMLNVRWIYFDVKNHPAIQDLAYRIVARIFELMTLQGDNCRYTNFPKSRPTYMCSVANKVELAFPINGGVIQGVLNVELKWSKNTGKDTFKCEGNTEGNVDSMMWTDYRGPLANAMSWPEKQLLPFVFCADDDCFKQNLKPSEPWHENDNCVPLDWPIGCDPKLSGPKNPKLNCPPETAPPKPVNQNKMLSIVYQEVRSRAQGKDEKSWLFFSSDFSNQSACRNEKDAVKKVKNAPGGMEQPPWPGGTYTLNLFGVECDYKNDGTNAGALYCMEELPPLLPTMPPVMAKTRRISCLSETTRWNKGEICERGAIEIARHKVVFCSW